MDSTTLLAVTDKELAEHYERSCNGDDLAAILKVAGVTKAGTRKADRALGLARYLSGDTLQATWSRLDATEQAVVAETVHSDAPYLFDENVFLAKYGVEPAWKSGGKGSSAWGATPTLLCAFMPGRDRELPGVLRDRLAVFVPAPKEMTVNTTEHPPSHYEHAYSRYDIGDGRQQRIDEIEQVPVVEHQREHASRREVLSVLRLIDAGKISVSDTTRKPVQGTIRAIADAIGDYYIPWSEDDHVEAPGAIRAFAWPMLLQAGGLAKASSKRLELTKSGRRALERPAEETLRDLWNAWISSTILDELSRIDSVKGQTGKGRNELSSVRARRLMLHNGLSECTPKTWLAVDELLRVLRAGRNFPSIVRDGRSGWSLYVGDPQYGSLGYAGYLDPINRRYVMCMLLEYAATLGLIDVALVSPHLVEPDNEDLWYTGDRDYLSRYDGLLYVRINPLGAYCTGIDQAYVPSEPVDSVSSTAIKVLPNGDIVLTGNAAPDDLLALDTFACRISDSVWQLDLGNVLNWVENGRDVDEIRRFLIRTSTTSLPSVVTTLLDDVQRRCGDLTNGGIARLVACADHALAQRIANDTATHKYCMLAGENHVVVPQASEAAFRRGLRKVGYAMISPDLP